MEKLRPCIAKGEKALFHRWADISKVVSPSPMVGGHNGGVVRFTVGIIEYGDGKVHECSPNEIKFVDNKISEFHFK